MAAFAAGGTRCWSRPPWSRSGSTCPRPASSSSSMPSASAWPSCTSCAAGSGAAPGHRPVCCSTTRRSGETRGRGSRSCARTEDGFVVAEEDLRLRGPGEILGAAPERAAGLPLRRPRPAPGAAGGRPQPGASSWSTRTRRSAARPGPRYAFCCTFSSARTPCGCWPPAERIGAAGARGGRSGGITIPPEITSFMPSSTRHVETTGLVPGHEHQEAVGRNGRSGHEHADQVAARAPGRCRRAARR